MTALSGSGPAYVFLLVEAMAAAGAKLGLAPDMASVPNGADVISITPAQIQISLVPASAPW